MNYVIDGSFQLIRTNPYLTTNVKLVVTSNYKLYFESINTNKQLNNEIYKHYRISKESLYEDKIASFYNGLPINIAFDVKDDKDNDVMYNKYKYQFDTIYHSGAKKIEDNEFYDEEFEYFAPLYLKKNKLPSHFVILRIDDPVVYKKGNIDYIVDNVNKTNFTSEIINKWKCVKLFDMTIKTDLGYWIEKNFKNNDRYPEVPFEFDSNKYNFSRWNGIDYTTGGYTTKNLYLKDKIYFENPHFKLEEFITDGFKNNELIFPNIINFKYLFDDTPATPFKLNKYSLNRYLGFYIDDFILVKNVSLYKQPVLIDNLKIERNIFMLDSQISGSTNPFTETWDTNKNYYIYAKNNLYQVVRIIEQSGTYYKIISEYDLTISDLDYENSEIDLIYEANELTNTYTNTIIPRYSSNFYIDEYIDENGFNDMYGDLYLINIDDKYHVLYKHVDESGVTSYRIRTDYAISGDYKNLKYWIKDENDSTYSTLKTVENYQDKPIYFPIYKVQFTDIKDFDFNRVDTQFSKFDFDKDDEYIETNEDKLYIVDYLDNSIPKDYKTYDTGVNQGKLKVVSSEYIADDELFEVTKNGLTDIWLKNQKTVKWGYSGSLSHSDYTYKLNNNKEVGGYFNKTTGVILKTPDIFYKTHDYFYRIGDFYDDVIANKIYYDNQSVSIETSLYKEESKKFNLDLYLNGNLNYFDYFFENYRYKGVEGDIEQKTMYSIFQGANTYNFANTLYKGIKYELVTIDNVIRNNEVRNKLIKKIITDKSNNIKYNGYKFSVILNVNYYKSDGLRVSTDSDVLDTNNILSSEKNGIHVFLNDLYKNVLVILNINLDINITYNNINNIKYFDGRETLYTNKLSGNTLDIYTYGNQTYNPNLITAYNYINAINNYNDISGFDDYVKYYYIDVSGQTGYTYINDDYNGNIVNTLYGKDSTPFMLNIELPNNIIMKKNSYDVFALKGPKYNIYDKFKSDYNEEPYNINFIKDPLSRIIKINENEIKSNTIGRGGVLEGRYNKNVYRYNGAYEPVFNEISLFDKSNYFYTEFSFFTITSLPYLIEEIVDERGVPWFDINNMYLCDNVLSYVVFNFTGSDEEKVSYYLEFKNFDINLPENATIKGIEISIINKALINNIYSKVYDNAIYISYNGSNISTTKSNVNPWSTTLGEITYGGTGDTWNISSVYLTPDIFNDDNFGVLFSVLSYSNITPFTNIAYIDCLNLKIYYEIDNIETGKTYISNFNKNQRFNTDIYNFGMSNEILFSKVNENENILKLKNTEEKSIYPMVDEYGYDYTNRFIFKTKFDSDYYIRTYENKLTANVDVYRSVVFFIENEDSDSVSGSTIYIYDENSVLIDTLITDINGSASTSLIVNKIYEYTIVNNDYITIDDNFALGESEDVYIINIELIFKTFTLRFDVSNQSDNSDITGATCSITTAYDGVISAATDINGECEFELRNGVYPFIIEHPNYQDYNGSVTINNANTTKFVEMLEVPKTVTFNVIDEDTNPINGITLSIIQNSSTTNILNIVSGSASVELVSGVYNFEISEGDYDYYYSGFTITTTNLNINVTLTFAEYIATFYVTGSPPISGATVNVTTTYSGVLSASTDVNGEADILLRNGTYNYTTVYSGYEIYNGSVIILNSNRTTNVVMTEIDYSVTFNIKDEDVSYVSNGTMVLKEGATTIQTISLNGSEIDINLPNGLYTYEITDDLYNLTYTSGSSIGNFVVSNTSTTVNVILYYNEYQVNYLVKDYDTLNTIQNAEINVTTLYNGVISGTTDLFGTATINLRNGNYEYSVDKPSYYGEYLNNIIINGSNVATNILLNALKYTVTFNVYDAAFDQPIQNLNINIKTSGGILVDSLLTNSFGIATVDLISGTYIYETVSNNYIDETDSFIISGTTVTNTLILENLWNVKFTVKDLYNVPIIAASIVLDDGVDTYTGNTNFSGVVDGQIYVVNNNYDYIISHDGYDDLTGTTTVNNSNVSIIENLTESYWDITFVVKNSSGTVLSNASVTFDGETKLTNVSGIAIFTNKIDSYHSGNYSYSISKSGYITKNGITSLKSDKTLNVLLSASIAS